MQEHSASPQKNLPGQPENSLLHNQCVGALLDLARYPCASVRLQFKGPPASQHMKYARCRSWCERYSQYWLPNLRTACH